MAFLTRYEPVRDMLTLRDAMDRLFQESFIRPSGWTNLWPTSTVVPMDVEETSDNYIVTASLPGWKPEDIKIDVQQSTLTISGQYAQPKAEQGKNYHLRERTFASFTRSFTFPGPVEADQAEATYDAGVLTLTLPKAASARPRTIRIAPVEEQKHLSAARK